MYGPDSSCFLGSVTWLSMWVSPAPLPAPLPVLLERQEVPPQNIWAEWKPLQHVIASSWKIPGVGISRSMVNVLDPGRQTNSCGVFRLDGVGALGEECEDVPA